MLVVSVWIIGPVLNSFVDMFVVGGHNKVMWFSRRFLVCFRTK